MDADGTGYIVVVRENGDGAVSLNAETLADHRDGSAYIEEVSPYADWPMDAKIRVWDDCHLTKKKAHFAGIDERGDPLTWVGGATSWTETVTISWDHAELAEDAQ